MLYKSAHLRHSFGMVAVLGVLSGLTFVTRVTDGGALFVGVAIAIVCLAPSRKIVSLLLFSVATAAAVVFVVSLTGDSLHDYAMTSIFKAAGSKGGATAPG